MSKRKEKRQELPFEFNDTVDDIIDKLKNPADNLSEDFAIKYEIDDLKPLAETLKRKLHYRMPKGKKVVLWHGTSFSRAKSILKSGFRSRRWKCRVFFSSNIMVSFDFGELRATAHSEPAIFAAICEVSKLTHSSAFGYEYYCRADVANQIVKYLLTCHGLYSIDTKRFTPDLHRRADKLKAAHKWQPPEIPRVLRQIVDNNRYAKMRRYGELLTERAINCTTTNGYYSRSEIQEMFYRYTNGRGFRIVESEAHFRLQQSSDIPLLAAYFELEDTDWPGFECTGARYNLIDNNIATCDIGLEIGFSASDYTSAIELAQILINVLQKYEIFCFLKFDGDEILEIVIPAEALPQQIDGQNTALRMHQITAGLGRGLSKMPAVNQSDCRLTITPYGYTEPAYSLNPETGLTCIILMPENLQNFSPQHANPDSVVVNNSWFEVPTKAPLHAQRFLKYALSPNWQPM